MPNPELQENRVENITAALVYLMTHYARTGCPRLAVCVSRHMQVLAHARGGGAGDPQIH